MIKSIGIGLWSGATALGGVYLALMLGGSDGGADGHKAEEGPKTVEFIKSDNLSVPIIRNGAVAGYVVTEMSFAVDKNAGGQESGNTAPYLVDAAYRTIYESISADFAHLKPQDLKELSDKVKETANKRLGHDAVQDVLISNINFVGKEEIRTNWVKDQHNASE